MFFLFFEAMKLTERIEFVYSAWIFYRKRMLFIFFNVQDFRSFIQQSTGMVDDESKFVSSLNRSLFIVLFDCVYRNGQDLSHCTLEERKKYLSLCVRFPSKNR